MANGEEENARVEPPPVVPPPPEPPPIPVEAVPQPPPTPQPTESPALTNQETDRKQGFRQEYRDILGIKEITKRSDIERSLFKGTQHTPEEWAEAVKLSRQSGRSVEFVLRQQKEMAARAKRQALDIDKTIRENPGLSEFLSTPYRAGLVNEDLDRVGTYERVMRSVDAGFRHGPITNEIGRQGLRLLTTEGPRKELQEKIKDLDLQIRDIPQGSGFIERVLYPHAKVAGQIVDSLKHATERARVGAMAGATVGFAGGPIAPATIPLFALKGAGIGLTFGFAEDVFAIEGGNQYLAMNEIVDEDGNRIDEETKQAAAVFTGLVNASLELVGLKLLTAPAKLLGRRFLKQAVNENIAKPTMSTAMRTFMRNWSISVGGEVTTEVMQEATSILAEEMGKAVTDGKFQTIMNSPELREETLNRLVAIASETFRGTILFGLPGAGGNLVLDARQALKAEASMKEAANLLKEMKITKIAPEEAQTLTQNIIEESDSDTRYIPFGKWVRHFQEANLNPRDQFIELVGNAESYDQSQANPEIDLEIPRATFKLKIAAVETTAALVGDTRVHSKATTPNEARAILKKAEQQAEIAPPLQEAMSEQESKSLDRVEAIIRQQLTAAGVPQNQQAAQVAIERARVQRRARLRQEDPVAVFRRSGLQILGPDVLVSVEGERVVVTRPTSEKPLVVQAGDKESKFVVRVTPQGREVRQFVQTTTGERVGAEIAEDSPLEVVTRENLATEGQDTDFTVDEIVEILGPDSVITRRRDMTQAEANKVIRQKEQENRDAVAQGNQDEVVEVPEFIKPARPAPPIIQTFRQGPIEEGPTEKPPRGQIIIVPGSALAQLLKTADPATWYHEVAGHFWLEEVRQDQADFRTKDPDTLTAEQKQFLLDSDEILAFSGGKSWDTIAQDHKAHEKWAKGMEKYFLEGVAPSRGLRRAFRAARNFIVRVYNSLRGLDVELSPKIREVMDRLVASQADIDVVRAEQGLAVSVFGSKADQVMTEVETSKLAMAMSSSREAAVEQLTEETMDDITKKNESKFQNRRKEIRAEIEDEVNRRPVFRALSALQTGKMPDGETLPNGGLPDGENALKLSKKDLVGLFDFTAKDLAALPKPAIFQIEGGYHPDIIAAMFGFRSGSELMNAIQNAPDRVGVIERETDARMQREFPDLAVNGIRLREQAEKAVNNDQQQAVGRLEMEIMASTKFADFMGLAKKISTLRIPTNFQIKQQVEQALGQQRVKGLNPDRFLSAAARASREAFNSFRDGRAQEAIDAKARQFFLIEMFRESVKARDNVRKALRDFKRFFKSDDTLGKSRDVDIVKAARFILSEFEIGSKRGLVDEDGNPVSAQEYLSKVENYDNDLFNVLMQRISEATIRSSNYKEARYTDFMEMKKVVDLLWDKAKGEREVTVENKKVALDDAIAELQTATDQIARPTELKQYNETKDGFFARAKISLMGYRAAIRRTESWADAMDQGDFRGAFRKFIWTPISKGADNFREAFRINLGTMKDALDDLKGRLGGPPILAPDIGFKFRNKSQLLGAIMHRGNASNFQKLLRGWGWGDFDASGNLDTSRWDAFERSMWREGILTEADYTAIQKIWDLFESIKPDIQRVHKEIYGFFFNEITAQEFEITTKEGKKVKFRGGYVPAKMDPYSSRLGKERSDKQALEDNLNSFAFPTVGRGATRNRIEKIAEPLVLDINVLVGHLDWAMRFIHIEPRVKDVARIVINPKFKKSISRVDSEIVSEMLIPWLNRAASQRVENPSKGSGWRIADRAFRALRRNGGMQIMVLNVVNTFQQFTGFSIAATKVSPRFFSRALYAYMRGPISMADDIASKSIFMRNLTGTQMLDVQRRIQEIMLDPNALESSLEFARKHGFFLQRATQNIVNVVSWSAAYDQATEQGFTEDESVSFADSVVRQTQGTFAAEDISRVETGTPIFRFFTQFWGYFNMQANLLATEFTKVIREYGVRKGAGRLLYVYTMGFMIPAVLSEMIVKAGAGDFEDEDDDGYLDEYLDLFFWGQIRTATALIPGGQLLQVGINNFNDRWYDDRITISPAVQILERVVRAPFDVYQAINGDLKSNKNAIKDVLTAIGVMTGLPAAPLARPLGYLSDISDGKAEPTGLIDFTRGLVTGRPGKP